MMIVTICGGGSLGHVISGWLSSKNKATVNLLTSKPEEWSSSVKIDTPDGLLFSGVINAISGDPSELIPQSDIVLFCLPGYAIRQELIKIRPFLRKDTIVGTVFSSTGFFYEAIDVLPQSQTLFGFQRVPFIARVAEYGHSAHLLGYKDELNIAIERYQDPNRLALVFSDWFERPVRLLKNYYEASLTNSNPLLHTARLYSLFHETSTYSRMVLFYEEWTDNASSLLIEMDNELFRILDRLPVTRGFLKPVLEYYESYDAESLTHKISSIQSFKSIPSPMIRTENGWVADKSSRYFMEDFEYGLKYIYLLAKDLKVSTPVIDEVYEWGKHFILL